jgi:hypothetical protein
MWGSEWPCAGVQHLRPSGMLPLCENPAEAQRLVGQDPGLLDARGGYSWPDAPDVGLSDGPCGCGAVATGQGVVEGLPPCWLRALRAAPPW